MNINNLTMSHTQQNIVRNAFNEEKVSFANMLIYAAESFRSCILPGENEDSMPAHNTASILNEEGDMAEGEDFKKIDYGNLCGMWDAFFHLVNQPPDDMSQSVEEIPAFESQIPYAGANRNRPQDIIAADRTLFENVTSKKPVFKNAAKEQPITENITAEKPMLESLTEEKEIQKNITREKPIPESKAENFPEAVLRYMPFSENKIIPVTDESSEIRGKILSQVKDKIIITAEKDMSGGTKIISMQLQPQNLGKIDIKLIYENERLTVEIKALNEETQKILSSNTNELKEMLGKTLSVKILVKSFDESDNNRYNQNAHGSEQPYFHQGQEQNQGNRQQKNYYNRNVKKAEKGIFSELINSSSLKEDLIGS